MATLYRKYRPLSFNEVVGQNNIKVTLQYEIKTGQMAHAYLFCGPRAVGKTTLARIVAKAVNCTNKKEGEFEPCNTCASCLAITEGRSFDLLEIDAASHTGVDNVRENIIASARTAPTQLKYKVFIIDEVHMLSGAAFNALLKIMEEPPAYIIFILATTEVHKIPATIISRCQRFDFHKISILDMVKKLEYILESEGIHADKAILENIARYSGGHMRDAESILGQIVSLADNPGEGQLLTINAEQAEMVVPKNNLDESLKFIEFLITNDATNAIRLVNLLAEDGFDHKLFLQDTIELMRSIMLSKISPELIPAIGTDLGESLAKRLLEAATKVNLAWLLNALNVLLTCKKDLRDASLNQLPLEMAVVSITTERVSARQENTPVAKPSPIQAPIIAVKEEVKVVEQKVAEIIDSVRLDSSDSARQANLELHHIISRWTEFLANVKKYNNSLSFALMTAKPTKLENNTVYLTFKHKIHKNKFSEIENSQLVEKVLLEVYNAKLSALGLLEEAVEEIGAAETPKTVPSSPAIDDVLKALGGKIVG